MARKTADGRRHPGHYLREWRKHRGYSMEEVVERLAILADRREQEDVFYQRRERVGISQGTLSRVERGEIPYNQHLMDLLAEVYGTDTGSLIMRNPLASDAPWSIYDQVKPLPNTFRQRVADFIAGLKATGTEG